MIMLTQQPTAFTSITSADIEPICEALAQAFFNDPFYYAVTVDSAVNEEGRMNVLAKYFQLAIEEGAVIGEVQCHGSDGAAIWATNVASGAKITGCSTLRNVALANLLNPQGYSRYIQIVEGMAKKVPVDLNDAWYLSILGVRPEARGKRIAENLLDTTLSRADQCGAVCYLETFNPLSIPFYQRLGFRQEFECIEEVTARPYWVMVRRASLFSPHPAV